MGKIDRLMQRFSLPEETIGECRVLMSGDCVRIENHRGILEFAEEFMLASHRHGNVRIRGEKLAIEAMDPTLIVVSGHIFGVDME